MYNTPSYSSYAPAQTGPRIGEWLSEAFTLFGREWLTWIGQGAVFLFLGFAPGILGYLIYIGAFVSYAATRGGAASSPDVFPTPIFVGMGAMLLGMFLSLFVATYLVVGMERTAAKQLRGQPISVRDIFSGGDVYFSSVVAALITMVAWTCGAMCFIIPGFILMGLLNFAYPILAEERVSGVEAVKRSWRATAPHVWMYAVWFFVLYLLQMAGGLVLVGYLVTMPIYVIALMIGYRDVFGLPGAVAPATAVPTVPMMPGANYGPAGAPLAAARCPACERPVAAGAVMCPHCQTTIPAGYTGPAGFTPPPAGFSSPPSGYNPPPANPGEPGA